MTGRITVPISVTATTGPKSGAPDQATGKEWAPFGEGWIEYSLNTQSRFIMFTQLVRTTTVPPSRWNSHPVMREQQDAVPIIDDRLSNEPVEPFSVSFVSFSPAGQEGPDRETCVFIEDDDGM